MYDRQGAGGAKAEFGALVRELIEWRGTSRRTSGARTGFSRRLIPTRL